MTARDDDDPRRLLEALDAAADDDDPGRARLEALAAAGLITPADVDALDHWAHTLASKLASGELTPKQVSRLVAERVNADLKRRGSA